MKITKVALFLGVFALMGLFSSVSVEAQSTTVSSSNNACVSLSSQLRKGHRGAAVMSLQQFLIAKGYLSADSNTGFFGLMTEAAVKSYQGANGISKLGNVGPMTLGRIQSDIAKACAGNNMSDPAPVPQGNNNAQTSAQIAAGMQLTGVSAAQIAKAPVCAGTTQDVSQGDLNNDNSVDMWDLVVLANNYNLPAGQLLNPLADKNGNNDVEFYEALKVAQLFGLKKCTTTVVPQTTNNATTNAQAVEGAQLVGISPSQINMPPVCTTANITQGDLNNDNSVDMWDLVIVARNYHLAAGQLIDPAADKNGNGTVDFYELLKVSQLFGKKSCSTTTQQTTTTQTTTTTTNTATTATNSSDNPCAVWAGTVATYINGVLYCVPAGNTNPTTPTTNNTTQAQYTTDQQLALTYATQFGISQDGLFNDPTTCTTNNITMGDLDSNGEVNWWDLVLLGRNYNKPAGTLTDPTADKNGDGVVNFSELLGVSQNWGKEACPSNNNNTNNASSAQSSS